LKFNDEEGFDKVLVDAECTHEGSLKHIYKFFKEEAINVIPHAKGEKKLSKQQEKQFKKNNTNPYTS
jgi:16S rRNA C967 or C1407 C5-methylase (RsmB/RsmF family)